MPLKYRNPNRAATTIPPLEHVKQEAPSPLSQDSSLSADDNNAFERCEVNEGRWTEEQNFKFVLFVHYYQEIFASRHQRKVCKIFRTFSHYLTERTPAQCRSHYQKMIIKHKSIAKLKKHYKTLFGDKTYAQQMQKFKESWEETHPPTSKASLQAKDVKEVGIQTERQMDQKVCENCNGIKSQSDLLNCSLGTYNNYPLWTEYSQFHNGLTNIYYWIPNMSAEWQ